MADKTRTYKLDGKSVVPQAVIGTELTFRVAENLQEIAAQCVEGAEAAVTVAAQRSIDIALQDFTRKTAAEIHAEMVKEGRTFQGDDREADLADFRERLQGEVNEWRFGQKSERKGGGVSKAKQENEKIKAEAANDPEFAAKLRALGIEV